MRNFIAGLVLRHERETKIIATIAILILLLGPAFAAPEPAVTADSSRPIIFSQEITDAYGHPVPAVCSRLEYDKGTGRPVMEGREPKCQEWQPYSLGYACILVLSSPVPGDANETLVKKVERDDLVRKIAKADGSHTPVALSPKEKRLIVDRLDKFQQDRSPITNYVAVLIARTIDPESLEGSGSK